MDTKIKLPTRIDTEKIEVLKELYPEVFQDGRINPRTLYEIIIGPDAEFEDEEEFYGLNWVGKKDARKKAYLPPKGTLLQLKGAGEKEGSTNNVLIEGDNLDVLRILKESYKRRIKLIYIDPPYNTGTDFIYKDNYREPLQAYLIKSRQADEEGLLTSNPKSGGRYHADWLSMMYPRLKVAKELLDKEGFICVSIGDEEYHNLKHLLDEVFGEENHRNTMAIRRYDKNLSQQFMDKGLTSLSVGYEYVVVYSNSTKAKLNPVFRETSDDRKNNGYWKGFWNSANRPTMRYSILGVKPKEGQWKWSQELAEEAVKNYNEYLEKFSNQMSLEEYWEKTGKTKKFLRRNPNGKGKNQGVDHWIPPSDGTLRTSNWTDLLASESLKNVDFTFDAPKNVNLIKEIIKMTTEDGDLVLDFFAGSGTTGQAVMELNAEEEMGNRQFVLVQINDPVVHDKYKTISQITLERLKISFTKVNRGDNGVKVYRLADSNFKVWKSQPFNTVRDLEDELDLFSHPHFTDGWTTDDVIIELMLKHGFPLDSTVYQVNEVNSNSLWTVEHYDKPFKMQVCIDLEIAEDTIPHLLNAEQKDLFICFDDALSDNSKVILSETLKVITL